MCCNIIKHLNYLIKICIIQIFLQLGSVKYQQIPSIYRTNKVFKTLSCKEGIMS